MVLAQVACGPIIIYNADFFFYEDLNGNGQQDSGETGLPNVPIQFIGSGFSTNSEGLVKGFGKDDSCPPMYLKVNGYYITEFSEPAWDCRTIVKENELIPSTIYMKTYQEGKFTIGMLPLNWMTKTASPTTFSGPNETITYSYFIPNLTNERLKNIYVEDDKAKVSCGAFTDIKVGDSLTCGSSYTTTEEDVVRGFITNTATFEFSDDSGVVFTSAPVSATVTLEEVQESAPPVPFQPSPVFTSAVLTGEGYTLCDPVNRPVNLRLVAGADTALISSELTNGNLQILIGGTGISSTCQVNPSNTTILTCTYPAGLTSLPAEGQVIYNTTVLQTFRFDGESNCTAPPKDNSSGGDSTGDQPATCDPNEPGTPCFCEANPYDESSATPD